MHIKSGKRSTPAVLELRSTAEKQLAELRMTGHLPYPQEHEAQRLIHELEVHQIELEIQNRELQQIRADLEISLEKYTDLYDFAPVGYCTLNREGAVQSANLPAAGLLGLERSKIIGRRFGLFVADESRHRFNDFIENVFSSGVRETCEVKLWKEGDAAFFVRIEAHAIKSGLECSIAVMDVSGRKRAEEEFHLSRMRLAWVLEKTAVGTWFDSLPLNKLNGDARTKSLLFFDPKADLTIEMFWSHIHPDDREPIRQAVENAITGHTLYEADFRALDPATGEIRWCHSAGQPPHDQDKCAHHCCHQPESGRRGS